MQPLGSSTAANRHSFVREFLLLALVEVLPTKTTYTLIIEDASGNKKSETVEVR